MPEGSPSEGAAEVMGFGKKLAHTDKKIRDRGLKILTTFLVHAADTFLIFWSATPRAVG